MHTSLHFLSLATPGALTLYHFSFTNGADRIYNLRSHMVELYLWLQGSQDVILHITLGGLS